MILAEEKKKRGNPRRYNLLFAPAGCARKDGGSSRRGNANRKNTMLTLLTLCRPPGRLPLHNNRNRLRPRPNNLHPVPEPLPLPPHPTSLPASKQHPNHLRPRTPRLNPHRPRPLRQPDNQNPLDLRPRTPHPPPNTRPLIQQDKIYSSHLAPHTTNRPLLRPEQNHHHREPLRPLQTTQSRTGSEPHPRNPEPRDFNGTRGVMARQEQNHIHLWPLLAPEPQNPLYTKQPYPIHHRPLLSAQSRRTLHLAQRPNLALRARELHRVTRARYIKQRHHEPERSREPTGARRAVGELQSTFRFRRGGERVGREKGVEYGLFRGEPVAVETAGVV